MLRSPERMASRIWSMRSCSFGGEGVLDRRWRHLPGEPSRPTIPRSAPYDGPHDVIRLTGAGDGAQARGIQCRRVPRLRPAPPAGARGGRCGDLRGAGVVEPGVPHPARRGAAVQRDGRVPVTRLARARAGRPHGHPGARHPRARRSPAEQQARRGRAGVARAVRALGVHDARRRGRRAAVGPARPARALGGAAGQRGRAGATGGATRGRATCRSWPPPWPASGTPSTRRGSSPSCRRCSAQDGVFEARYDPNTRRTPDERVAQLDGSAWVVWGAHQLAVAAPDRAVELLTPLHVDARAQRDPADVRHRLPHAPAEGLVRLLGARRAAR